MMNMMRTTVRTIVVLTLISQAERSEGAEPKALRGEIVYTAQEGSQTNIYRMAMDEPKPILVFKGSDPVNGSGLEPRWADGMKRIVFTARRGGHWQLLSCDRNGGDVRAEPGQSAFDAPPAQSHPADLSTDAGDLVYAPPGGKPITLYSFNAFKPRKMVEDGHAGVNDAVWGPGRDWILFSTCGERGFAKSADACHLRLVAPDGSGLKDLGPGEAADWQSATP